MEDLARNLPVDFSGRHILVTGGCGYVGNAIVRALLRHGAALVVLFDLSTPPLDLAPDAALATLFKERTKTIIGDVADPKYFTAEALGGFGLDTVIHVASFGMSGIDMLTRAKIHRVNYEGTLNIINTCTCFS